MSVFVWRELYPLTPDALYHPVFLSPFRAHLNLQRPQQVTAARGGVAFPPCNITGVAFRSTLISSAGGHALTGRNKPG